MYILNVMQSLRCKRLCGTVHRKETNEYSDLAVYSRAFILQNTRGWLDSS
eukprot:m.316338 g.316338  ORF g.316338 m.316338 type:complete len:50 (+) comp27543_c0_seq1:3485-3634(+)